MNGRWTGNLAKRIGLLLVLFAATAQAVEDQRFLEQVTSQTRADQVVVAIQLVDDLQYLSHSPPDFGQSVVIRLRAQALTPDRSVERSGGPGLQRIDPAAIPEVDRVVTMGSIDSHPGIVVHFDAERRYDIRPGRDDRSIEVVLVEGGGMPDALAQPVPPGETAEERSLVDLFHRARLAYGAGEVRRTTALYEQIIASGIEPYVREATLALAIVRIERGQEAQARALLERYLEAYPDGPGARHAASLQAALLEPSPRAADDDPVGDVEVAALEWYGAFEQFYLHDFIDLDGRSGETTRSSLLTATNVNWRGQLGGLNISGRFAGSRDDSFLDERDLRSRISYAYVDVERVDGQHRVRLGRQRLSSSGVLGYFDGLHYQYALNAGRQAIRTVVGAPVRSTRSGFDSDRLFGGVAIDFSTLDDRWYLSLYGLEQEFDSETDRRALGAEARFHGGELTGYALVDYDVYFDQLNVFRLFGNWRFGGSTVASLTLDERRSPGLALSNALYSEPGADSFDDLLPGFTDTDLQRLALDRSLVYRSAFTTITRQLDPRWEALVDVGVSRLRNDGRAWAGVPIDSDDWHVQGQLLGRGLFDPTDTYSIGLRYTDGERFDRTSLMLRSRLPVGERWRLSPRLRVDYRERDEGTTGWQVWPSLIASYRLSPRTALELDTGLEFTATDYVLDDSRDDRYFYVRAGYRHDF